jgi:hypothetical protein
MAGDARMMKGRVAVGLRRERTWALGAAVNAQWSWPGSTDIQTTTQVSNRVDKYSAEPQKSVPDTNHANIARSLSQPHEDAAKEAACDLREAEEAAGAAFGRGCVGCVRRMRYQVRRCREPKERR